MHCRLSSSTKDFPCSSFDIPKHSSRSQSDRIPTIRHRRRRLEDPINTYASNYYVTNPDQTSHSSSSSLPIRPKDKNIYCDLFNLLERPPSVQSKNEKSRQSKGFFRRVVRNYFCMPMTIAN